MSNEIVKFDVRGITADDFDKNAKATVSVLVERASKLTNEEKIKAINAADLAGRASWVVTAINIATIIDSEKKGRTDRAEKLQSTLNYSRSAVLLYAQAGRKLIKGDFERIPQTMNEFVKGAPKEHKFDDVVNVGLILGTFTFNPVGIEKAPAPHYCIYKFEQKKDGKPYTFFGYVPDATIAGKAIKYTELTDGSYEYSCDGKKLDIIKINLKG